MTAAFLPSARCTQTLIAWLLLLAAAGRGLPAAAVEPATGDWRAALREFAAGHFHHPAWGYSHALRDYELARDLARDDHATLDDDVLYAAALVHDIAAFAPWADPKVDHADAGARSVDTVLRDAGFPMGKLEAVRDAIRTHMYDREPVGPEALYLHDADSLDWLGAIGVARLFATVDAAGGAPNGPTIARGLQDLLAKVPARILTPAGRARLEVRRAELARFLDELKRESRDFATL